MKKLLLAISVACLVGQVFAETATLSCVTDSGILKAANLAVSGKVITKKVGTNSYEYFYISKPDYDKYAKTCIQILGSSQKYRGVEVQTGSNRSYSIFSEDKEFQKILTKNSFVAQFRIVEINSILNSQQENNGEQFFKDIKRDKADIKIGNSSKKLNDIINISPVGKPTATDLTSAIEQLTSYLMTNGKKMTNKQARAAADFIIRYGHQGALTQLDLTIANNGLFMPIPDVRKYSYNITAISENKIKIEFSIDSSYKNYTILKDGIQDLVDLNEGTSIISKVPFTLDISNYQVGVSSQMLKIAIPKTGFSLYKINSKDIDFIVKAQNSFTKTYLSYPDLKNKDSWMVS